MLNYISSATYFVAGQQSEGTHCCISITTLNIFIFLTSAASPAIIKRELLLRVHGNDAYANAPEWNVLITFYSLLNLYWTQSSRIWGGSYDRNVQDVYATTTTIIIFLSPKGRILCFYNSSPISSTQHALLKEDYESNSWQQVQYVLRGRRTHKTNFWGTPNICASEYNNKTQ